MDVFFIIFVLILWGCPFVNSNAIDCSSYCSIVNSTGVAVSAGHLLAEVSLSSTWVMQFEVKFPSLATWPNRKDFVNLKDRANSSFALAVVGVSDGVQSRWYYAGNLMDDYGPNVVTGYSSSYTTFRYTCDSTAGTVSLVASSDYGYTEVKSVSIVSTSGKTYYVYASQPVDELNPSAGGTIRNMFFTGE